VFTCYCIGNPLVDLIADVDDDCLERLGLKKGYFHKKTKKEAAAVLEEVKGGAYQIIPGGAAANTSCGIARMGGGAYLSGGIGDDELGQVFQKSLYDTGVSSGLNTYDDPTGFVVVLVTPDAERTFAVYLGSSLLLEEKDLDYENIRQSTFLYFTGYQFEPEGLRKVIRAGAAFCRKMITRVAMDLGDPGIVERNRDEMQEFVREYVDVLFANEEEGYNYTGTSSAEECIDKMGEDAEYAVLTLGEKGSMIKHMDSCVTVEPYTVTPVDTTGAGDMYTAGILSGFDKGYSLEYSGKMGSYAASLVIAQKGARLDKDIGFEVENL
jgi:sugar/nucleoside kinase (ribokinase family)